MTHTTPNQKLVAFYSRITIWAAVYGVLVAHGPYFFGINWSTCNNCRTTLGCVILIHLLDIPPCLFNLYTAWYCLKRYTANTQSLYLSLLSAAVGVNIAFFYCECIFTYSALRSSAPAWEIIGTGSIALIVLASCAMIIYIKQTLIKSTINP